jgi:membrane protein YdbS with pleckstrin-like domain
MTARKKSASKQSVPSQPRPELALYPRRGRSVLTLVLCLLILAIITDALLSVFSGTSGSGTELLFVVFFVICVIFLLGLGWSAVRLLTDRRPSFQIDEDGLTVRHLPFLGNVVVPWSEIRSVHTYRSLFFSYLCFVPRDIPQLVRRYGLLRFAFNSSTRLSLRSGTPLTISQALLETPVNELARRIEQDYGVKPTAGTIGK